MSGFYIENKKQWIETVPLFDKKADDKIFWQADSALSLGKPAISDWSAFNSLTFTVFSEKKTDSTVMLRFITPVREDIRGNAPFWQFPLKVYFEGEKKITIDLLNIRKTYLPTYTNIVEVSLECSGFGLTPDPETKLTFSDFRLGRPRCETESPVPLDDPSVFDIVKDNWREFLVGRPEGYSKDNEEINKRIKYYSEKCQVDWDTFRDTYNGEKGSAWNTDVNDYPMQKERSIYDAVCGGEVDINNLYIKIKNMVWGYATNGCAQFRNPELLEDIKKALEYMYRYYYGPNVWQRGIYGNWWYWQIGIPKSLTEILVVVEKDIGSELAKRYITPFDRLVYYPSMTACNKLWVSICIFASCLIHGDAERIMIAKNMLLDIFDYVDRGDGFYTDGSFIQHGAFAYTGGYGNSMLGTLTDLMQVFRGSRFEFTEEAVKNQYRWIFENYKPVIYKGNLMASMRGREVDRKTSESAAQISAVTSMIKMTVYAPDDIKKKLESLIRHYMLSSGRTYAENVPLMLVEYVENLYKDENVKPLHEPEFVKVFGNMDRVVRHGKDFGVCIAPNSSRIYKYESLNNENMDGWYQSEGMVYIYTGNYDYSYEFFNYVNPYKMPGTTVSTRERVMTNVGGYKGKFPFVGGVEAGENGLAVFRMGYPQNPHHNTDIEANKSYFLFDGEIVCVGSGIKDTFDKEVITVIEDRLIRDGDKFSINGKEVVLTEKAEKTFAEYAHFSNMGGYVFLENTEVTYDLYKNTNSFLEMTVSHGVKPENGKYAYVYLPLADEKKTAEYFASPLVEVLENSENIHVVRKTSSGVTGYAFYKAGKSNGVEVSDNCCVMITEKDGIKTINVSDPTHLLENLKVTVYLDAKEVASADDNVKADLDFGKITLDISLKGNRGQTFTAVVK